LEQKRRKVNDLNRDLNREEIQGRNRAEYTEKDWREV
jgi:hypothetical protein